MIGRFPFIGFILAQILSIIFLKLMIELLNVNLNGLVALIIHFGLGAFFSMIVFKLPKWFTTLSFIFPLMLYLGLHYLKLPAFYYGIILVLIYLTFSHTFKERVPLYLSNQLTTKALIAFILKHQLKSFIDLGSGTGRVVRTLAQSNIKADGAETAPLLYFFSSLLSFKNTNNGKIINKSIWDINLCEYDCVYTFLSPAVMDQIGEKFQKEMRPGTYLISNSFPINNIRAHEFLTLEDKRRTKLYIYLKK